MPPRTRPEPTVDSAATAVTARPQIFSGTLSDPGPAARLNANQRRVLLFLLQAKPYIITFAQIAAATAMGEASARTILRRLEVLDFLAFKKARDGNLQGIRMAFNQELCQAFRASLEGAPDFELGSLSLSQSKDLSISQTLGLSVSQPISKPHSQPASQPPLFQKEGKDSILPSDSEEKGEDFFAAWSDDLLTVLWPLTHQAGFRMEHLRRAAAMRLTLGKPLERDMVRLSLDRCEWELEKFGHLNELASGEKVRNTQAYVFTALARWGILRPHPDYVSQEEELIRQAAQEIEERKKALRLLEEAQFTAWRDALSQTEMEQVLRGCPGGPRDIWLKNYWKKTVSSRVGAIPPSGGGEAG